MVGKLVKTSNGLGIVKCKSGQKTVLGTPFYSVEMLANEITYNYLAVEFSEVDEKELKRIQKKIMSLEVSQ